MYQVHQCQLPSYLPCHTPHQHFFFFVFFWFLAWYFHSYLEAFPKIFFFGFYMHGKLWISSFQWSWPWLIWSYDNWDITLKREVTQNREILSVFSWKNHIFQSGADIFEPFWWNLAKTLFFKMVQLVHSSSCPIGTVYCAKSGKKYQFSWKIQWIFY